MLDILGASHTDDNDEILETTASREASAEKTISSRVGRAYLRLLDVHTVIEAMEDAHAASEPSTSYSVSPEVWRASCQLGSLIRSTGIVVQAILDELAEIEADAEKAKV
jgi:hypothetical protein